MLVRVLAKDVNLFLPKMVGVLTFNPFRYSSKNFQNIQKSHVLLCLFHALGRILRRRSSD